jgi:hypothetical protein
LVLVFRRKISLPSSRLSKPSKKPAEAGGLQLASGGFFPEDRTVHVDRCENLIQYGIYF